MSKFGIALMTAAAISLLSGCQAAKEKHPTQEELIRQMQQRAAAPDTHTAAGQSHAGSTDALRLHAQRGGYGSIAQQRTLPGENMLRAAVA